MQDDTYDSDRTNEADDFLPDSDLTPYAFLRARWRRSLDGDAERHGDRAVR
jgi:hypothetical protein